MNTVGKEETEKEGRRKGEKGARKGKGRKRVRLNDNETSWWRGEEKKNSETGREREEEEEWRKRKNRRWKRGKARGCIMLAKAMLPTRELAN